MNEPLPPPYPGDTSAKGWRFEIAMEKVRQSDTWSLTLLRGYEPKALLLWMWSVAWEQTPCGSFPSDEALIAARLELPPKVWQKHRDILMRNWWLASDGRLYHDTITERVLAMLDKRASDAKRAADRRARNAESPKTTSQVTQESRVTQTVLHHEFDTKHQAPSTRKENSDADASVAPTPSGDRSPPKAKTPKPAKEPPPTASVWAAYSEAYEERYGAKPIRNASVNGKLGNFLAKLPADEAPGVAAFYVSHNGPLYCNSGHAVDLLLRDAEKLRTEWVTGRGAPVASQRTYRERDADALATRVREMTGGMLERNDFIDMEATDATAITHD